MAIYLNNGRGINEINTAITLINGLQNNIIEYDSVMDIINSELYYLLKHKTRYPNNRNLNQVNQQLPPSRDDIMCALIDKLEGFYIKTPEVKKILNYFSYTQEDNMEYTWFIKNIEKGYVPTAVVIKDVIPYLNMNNIEYLYEKFSSKFKPNEIFTFNLLYNNVFTHESNYNPILTHNIFTKFKLTGDEINHIMNIHSYNKSYMLDPKPISINNYITNIIKYKKEYNFKYTHEELHGLFTWLQQRNIMIPIMNYKYHTDDLEEMNNIEIIRNDFKNMINHFNATQLYGIITIILSNTGSTGGYSNIDLCLNFIVNYCSFDKFKMNNVSEMLKSGSFIRFPLSMFDHFYDDAKDLELVDMFLTFNKANEQQLFELLINNEFIKCSNEELFNMAIEKGNTSLIKYFINKKFIITEDMILNNTTDKLLDILVLCAEHGFYITEKCFPHIVYVMFITNAQFSNFIDKIKNASIYVNDNDEFEKHKKKIIELYDLYHKLVHQILHNYNNTVEYFKDKKVTKEHIIIAENKRVREYLLNRLFEERNSTIKKVIVKKVVVKKVVKKTSDS
jgi:hypothetical protein